MVQTLRKGNSYRAKVLVALRQAGFEAVPRGIGYPGDDITATIDRLALSVEAKNHQRLDLAGFLDQAVSNCPSDAHPVVVAHRRGKGNVLDDYAVMRLGDLLALIAALE